MYVFKVVRGNLCITNNRFEYSKVDFYHSKILYSFRLKLAPNSSLSSPIYTNGTDNNKIFVMMQ
jgi:hypothetical protein